MPHTRNHAHVLTAKTGTALELMPGHVAYGQVGGTMKTLLGSCVSVILTDPRRTVGIMNHIVHVGHPKHSEMHNTAFGTVSMQSMFAKLRAVGINPSRCEAYVYGGGNMFPQLFIKKHVGASNVDWVLNFLDDHTIPIIDHSLGGNGYRKISWTVGPTEPLLEIVFAEQGSPQ